MLLGQYPDLAGIYNTVGAADGVARALMEMKRALRCGVHRSRTNVRYAQFFDRGNDGCGHHPETAEHGDELHRYLQQLAGSMLHTGSGANVVQPQFTQVTGAKLAVDCWV
jgi:hypothetical protein